MRDICVAAGSILTVKLQESLEVTPEIVEELEMDVRRNLQA